MTPETQCNMTRNAQSVSSVDKEKREAMNEYSISQVMVTYLSDIVFKTHSIKKEILVESRF